MSGGHERSVTVWDVHWTLARQRYDAVCEELERLRAVTTPASPQGQERLRELDAERLRLLAALGWLGPSPRAKMG